MILDPHNKGCNIWHNDKVSSIKGTPEDVCRELYKRVTVFADKNPTGEPIIEQLCDIGIDIGGVGIVYKDILNSMGLNTYDIRGRNIDIILPIRNKDMVGINQKYNDVYDCRFIKYNNRV